MRLVEKSPEMALWFAVLMSAVEEAQEKLVRKRRAKREQRDPSTGKINVVEVEEEYEDFDVKAARDWFADNRDGPGSFLWIAAIFEIRPSSFRMQLMTRKMRKTMRAANLMLGRSADVG